MSDAPSFLDAVQQQLATRAAAVESEQPAPRGYRWQHDLAFEGADALEQETLTVRLVSRLVRVESLA